MNKSKRKWYFLMWVGIAFLLSLTVALVMIVLYTNFYYLLISLALSVLLSNRAINWMKWCKKDVKKVVEELK